MIWLDDDEIWFPPQHMTNEAGVIAVGGDLSVDRLTFAYQLGIFPWYNDVDGPIIWWCPNPRFVLFPDELRVSKSMRPYFNQQKFEVTYNQHFSEVMRACMNIKREGMETSWINKKMISAYAALNKIGRALSIEVWKGKKLVGGLYGVRLGKVFFGESMFAKESNASKFGFITLVRKLKKEGVVLIDCQQETRHLASMGGRNIPRIDFLKYLDKHVPKKL